MPCKSPKGSASVKPSKETVPSSVLLPPAGSFGNSMLEACSDWLLGTGTSYKTWLEGSGRGGGEELLHPVLPPLNTPLLDYMLS